MKPGLRERLQAGEKVLLPVTGTSMGEAYREAESFLIAVAERPPGLGRIVLIEDQGELKVHRLILRFRRHGVRMILCRGDGSRFFDRPLPEAEGLVGEAVAVQQHGELVETRAEWWPVVRGWWVLPWHWLWRRVRGQAA